MHHVWTVLCRQVITDRDSNQLTLVNAVENVLVRPLVDQIPDDAVIPLDWVLVSMWTRSNLDAPEEAQYRVMLLSPDSEPSPITAIDGSTVFRVDMTEKRRMRTQLQITTLRVGPPGTYAFRVDLGVKSKWTTVAIIPYDFALIGGEADGGLDAAVKATKKRKPRKAST